MIGKLSFFKCAIVFFVSFLLRLAIILSSDKNFDNIDLCIYRDTGQLISWRTNPYNFNDSPELRERLRQDGSNWSAITAKSQESWNYYASSNLPLAAIFFGVIEHFFHSSVAYRIAFAFMDSLLAVLILLFVFKRWRLGSGVKLPFNITANKLFAIALMLVALSPTLIYWGVIWPEHKGTGILLILLALYFSYSSNSLVRIGLSSIFLGFSVAFIGLGVFVAPLCLYNIYRRTPGNFKPSIIYSVLSILSCFIWFLPFIKGILSMMSGRLTNVLVATHSSLWYIVSLGFPEQWIFMRKIVLVLFLVVLLLGLLRNHMSFGLFSASLLLWFVSLYLTNGSIDRANIGFVCSIVILGCEGFLSEAVLLTGLSFAYGAFYLIYYLLVGHTEIFDPIYTFAFTLIYIALIFRLVYSKKAVSAIT